LAGERQRPGAGLADARGCEMAVDDGVDLVAPLCRLVDALREAAHDALCTRPPAVEGLDLGFGKAGVACDLRHARALCARLLERLGQSVGVAACIAPVNPGLGGQPLQLPLPKALVGALAGGVQGVGGLTG